MVAFQHGPVFAVCDAVYQVVNHALAVGPAINQITDMDHRRVVIAMLCLIGGDALVDILQAGEVAVDIADGIDAVYHAPTSLMAASASSKRPSNPAQLRHKAATARSISRAFR